MGYARRDSIASSNADFRPRTETPLVPSYVGGFVSFDISALAEQWVRDDFKNKGFELSAVDESAANVVSLEGPASTGNGPSLEIVYSTGTGLERDKTYETVGIDDRSSAALNVAAGTLSITSQDIKLPGVAGLDLSVGRTYNNRDSSAQHGFVSRQGIRAGWRAGSGVLGSSEVGAAGSAR